MTGNEVTLLLRWAKQKNREKNPAALLEWQSFSSSANNSYPFDSDRVSFHFTVSALSFFAFVFFSILHKVSSSY